MIAVILAAGRGSRLAPLTDDVPKPMLEILGKPILAHIIDNLPDDVTEVIIVVKYLQEVIQEYFKESYNGKKITYVTQGSMLGTYGALLSAKGILGDSKFMVLGADDIVEKKELAEIIQHDLSAGYNLKPIPSREYEVFKVEKGRVIDLVKVPENEIEKDQYFATGTYVLDKTFWEYEPTLFKGVEYGIPHTLKQMFKDKLFISVEMKNWIQINSHQEYQDAEKEISLRRENISYRNIHIIGVGGIGISAVARHYNSLGVNVGGSDISESKLINDLQKEGIEINIGCSRENVKEEIDMCVYSIAIDKNTNKEYLQALEIQKINPKLKILSYPEALSEITSKKRLIAVCGTHGKTTTTAMAERALRSAGINVTMILGSLIDYKGIKTNYIPGDSEWMLIEACEYKRSFLNYNPEVVLITNIDADHLDYYKDLDDIVRAFNEFTKKVSSSGAIILHENEIKLISASSKIINVDDNHNNEGVVLSVPGTHNRENANLVLGLGKFLGLDDNLVRKGLYSFTGTWRRQEYKGHCFGIECYDDYAHHPTEVKATIESFREKYPESNIIVAFMPHLYSRTKVFFDEFVESFSKADEVIVLPIYAAREKFDETINSKMLSVAIEKKGANSSSVDSISDLKDFLTSRNFKNDTVLITMGAGNIDTLYTI